MIQKLGVALWDRVDFVEELSRVQDKGSWDEFLKQYYDMENVNNVNIQDSNQNRKAILM